MRREFGRLDLVRRGPASASVLSQKIGAVVRESRWGLLALALLGLSACSNEPAEQAAASLDPLNADAWGVGTPPSAEHLAMIDRDVRPDGTGLPPGQGSVSEGAELYVPLCASCHGITGVEGPNNVLVGGPEAGSLFATDRSLYRTIGNYWPYATTIYDYLNRAMPQNAAGSLTPNQLYALTAYLLYINGVVDEGTILSADNLPAIEMPAQPYFVPDDREGGRVLR